MSLSRKLREYPLKNFTDGLFLLYVSLKTIACKACVVVGGNDSH